MEMKQCSACKVHKETSEFYRNKAKRDGLGTSCKSCRAIYIREHYKKNKSYYIAKADKSKYLIRDEWGEYKKSLKCCKCGFDHPAALDFHHRDSKQKEFCISYGIRMGYSKDKILREIQKCEVLCANCHRILHYNES